MRALTAITYVVLVVLAGFGVTGFLLRGRRRSQAELAGLSVALGAATIGFLLFLFSLAGVSPNRPLLLGLELLAVAGIVALRQKGWLTNPLARAADSAKHCPLPWWGWVPLLAFLALTQVAVVWHAVTFPLVEWDAFCIWGLKAKLLAAGSLTPVPDYFQDVRLSFSHLDYPLGLPFLTAGAYAAMGTVDDQLGKILLPFLFLALSLLLYAEFARRLGPGRALALVCLTAGTPSLVRWAGSGNADVPLALFYGGALLYTWRWCELGEEADRTIAVVLAAFAALVKNEGLPLGILCMAILAVSSWLRRKRLPLPRSTVAVCLAFWGAAALWYWWSRDIPRSAENYGGRLHASLILANAGRLPLILRTLGDEVVRVGCWGLIWLLLPVAAVLGWSAFRRPAVLVLWCAFAAHLGLLVVAFLVTPWENLPVLMAATLERVLIPCVPVAALILAAHWEACTPAAAGSP